MARVLGVDIPDNKRFLIALTYVKGIGLTTSRRILAECGIDESIRTKELGDEDFVKVRSLVQQMEIPIEGELKRIVAQNVRRFIDIRSYRGDRHSRGLPVRGQRSRSNARTRKGKRKTVGGAQKKASAKK